MNHCFYLKKKEERIFSTRLTVASERSIGKSILSVPTDLLTWIVSQISTLTTVWLTSYHLRVSRFVQFFVLIRINIFAFGKMYEIIRAIVNQVNSVWLKGASA